MTELGVAVLDGGVCSQICWGARHLQSDLHAGLLQLQVHAGEVFFKSFKSPVGCNRPVLKQCVNFFGKFVSDWFPDLEPAQSLHALPKKMPMTCNLRPSHEIMALFQMDILYVYIYISL